MYEPLYSRIPEFEEREGVEVEMVVAPSHPDLNERIEKEFGSGSASYDLISTHVKYALSQKQWLTSLDEALSPEGISSFSEGTLELARIEGALCSIPRNLDVKLPHCRMDLLGDPPVSWDALLEEAARLRSEETYGFALPGKESGLFGHLFELHAMHGGRIRTAAASSPEARTPTQDTCTRKLRPA